MLLDRGMDIAHAEFRGLPVSWDSKNGAAGPGYFERPGQGWLRTFGGGLLTTCGLTQVGPPNIDAGEELGLHGRISHLPAERYELEEGWEGDDYVLRVRGRVRESVIYGENLLLKREIACRMGGTTITVNDVIENQGYRETPFMLLYHLNFGFPVVSEHTRLVTSGSRAEAGNEEARRGTASTTASSPPPRATPTRSSSTTCRREGAAVRGPGQRAAVLRGLGVLVAAGAALLLRVEDDGTAGLRGRPRAGHEHQRGPGGSPPERPADHPPAGGVPAGGVRDRDPEGPPGTSRTWRGR